LTLGSLHKTAFGHDGCLRNKCQIIPPITAPRRRSSIYSTRESRSSCSGR
jgi:hypothetical protein